MPAFVPAAARAMSVFEAFAQHRRELTNAEVAKFLGVAESSSSDVLHTLQELGYLTRTAGSRRFYPTSRLRALVSSLDENDALANAGREAIALVARQLGETSLCGVLRGHHVEVLGIEQGDFALRYILEPGARIGLHVSGLGKALLAALPPADARALLAARPLKQVTPHSVVDPAVLMRQLRDVRVRGYARVEDEGTDGVAALGIAGRVGSELLAVSIAGPTSRFRQHRDRYRTALLALKTQIFGAAG